MDGEQRLIVVLTLIALILLFIVCLVLLFVLWPYRVIIAVILLSIFILVLLLAVGLAINEGFLRHRRVKFQYELPLDEQGQPLYLKEDMKPYRQNDPRYD